MSTEDIPIIDLSDLAAPNKAARLACGRAIGEALKTVGFFQAVGHGVDAALTAQVYEVAQAFFARPVEEKMTVALSPATGFCGYFPLLAEVTDPAFGGDPKEGFDISLSAGPEGLAALRWPPNPPDLPAILTRYHEAMCGFGRLLSRGFALALEMPEDFFEASLDRPMSILRILHYPALAAAPNLAELPFGCGAHSDYGYLTMLTQDSQGGLEVQTRAGEWISVAPHPDAFVCNVGELMARWTNDLFRATPHRVVRRSAAARYSIPFFFHPNPGVLIDPLKSCVPEGSTPLYPPILSGAYLEARQNRAYA